MYFRVLKTLSMYLACAETSGSQTTCGTLRSVGGKGQKFIAFIVAIAREAGDYTVATSMTPPEQCKVYE